jgi:hypothetical protein
MSSEDARYTTTDKQGKFVIDGLIPGEYNVSVFDADEPFPNKLGLLADPRTVKVEGGGCSAEVILVHPKASQ